MRAVQIRDYGGAENLELIDAPMPTPQDGEVLIKLDFAGLRWGDIMQRGGFPTRDRPVPFIGGQEGAGVIEKVGNDVSGWHVGQRVMAMLGNGGFAEYVTCEPARLVAVPDHVPLEKSLAYPVNLRTAYLMVYEWAKVQPGEAVLLHAAAGGVGMMATQIMKRRLKDVTVIGLASNDEKCAAAIANGCDHCINYKTQDYVAETLRLTGGPRAHQFDFQTVGGGVDVVFNGVSGPTLDTDHKVIRRRGRWVIYGWAGGRNTIDTSPFGYYGITIMPFSSLAWTGTPQDAASRQFVSDWMANEPLIEPVVYSLEDAERAQRDLEAGRTAGKVILKI